MKPEHLWSVTCDNQEPWAEDHNEFTTLERAATSEEACALGKKDQRAYDNYVASAELVVKNINLKEAAYELLPQLITALDYLAEQANLNVYDHLIKTARELADKSP